MEKPKLQQKLEDVREYHLAHKFMSFPEFVWIGDDVDDRSRSIELPCENDNRLLLSTVRTMFEGAINIKYSHGGARAHRLCKVVHLPNG